MYSNSFAANPKKEYNISFDIDACKKAVHKIIQLEPEKYTLVNDDSILNQIRFHEKFPLLDIGYHIDFGFKKISDTETNVNIEISRKMGTINNRHEVHNSNYILKEVTDKFSSYLSGKTDIQTGKAVIPKNDGCIGVFAILIIAGGFLAYLLSI